jgi:hypothetical protein
MTDFGFQSLGSIPGGLNYLGTWDALTNTPTIVSSVGSPGDYYIVSVAGNTSINGISDWQIGDWIIFSTSGVWQKIDNSDLEGYNLIQEEGVSLPKESILNFVGAGVSASAGIGQTIVNIPGSIGSSLYYMNQTINQSPYKEFSSIGTTAAEQIVPATVAGGATTTIAAYQTPSGVPNTTVIPQGLWQFFLHFNATTAGQNWIIRPFVYKRDLGGIETLIFTPDPEIVTNMSTTTTMYACDGVIPTTTLLTTDRIVVKIDMQNTTGVSQTVNFRTEGSQHYSVATTTLNQAVPTGAVTSVTGTAPVVSSGGTTPAISMAAANGTTNGYLTSTDWTTFNNKVSSNIYTANGTLSGTRVVSLNNNDLTFTDGGAATARFQVNIDDGTNAVVIDAANSFGVSLSASSSGGAGSLSVTTSGVNVGGYYNLPQSAGSIGQVLTRTSGSNTTWSTPSGLVYFTEAQSTAAPNGTVNVDSLTAVAGTTNADFAIVPKGTGAILAAIPDNTTAGGNKRGTRAIDLSTATRSNADRVASGDSSVIIGQNCRAYNTGAVAIGSGVFSGGLQSVGLSTGFANGDYAFSIGSQSTASGRASVAFGGTQYGAVTASGEASVAQGNSTASGLFSIATGEQNTASAQGASAVGGRNNLANAYLSSVSGGYCTANLVEGRQVRGRALGTVVGETQKSEFFLSIRTTGNTATTVTVAGGAAGTSNQVILSNQSAYRFKGTIIGKQSGSTNVAAWDVDGIIVRGANAASTVLTVSTVTLVSNAPAWGTPTLSADTTNGGLQVQVIGASATNIQWTATIETTEVIYS